MKIIFLCFFLILSACSNKIDVQQNSKDFNFYEVVNNNNNNESYLKIYFDKNVENLICCIEISNRAYTDELVDSKTVYDFQQKYNNSIANSSDYIATYDYGILNSKKGYNEIINLNLYYDDQLDDASSIIEYLGLSDELKDQLLYLDELLESETFKYKWIIEEGSMKEFHLG